MRPNDVMIDDWLLFTDPDAGETSPVQIEKDDIGFDGDGFWKLFTPIPITPEILHANGFIQNGYMCRFYHNLADFDNHAVLEYNLKFSILDIKHMKNRAWTAKLNMDVQFVHELQHAFRLVGLEYLANNFKVEGGTQ